MSKRFLIIHGCGPLAMAASSTLSAASRYCSIRKEETCSASALLSKPFAGVSGGSRSFRSMSTPSRSRTVFSYSARLSRRIGTRPWVAFRAASAVSTRPRIQSVKAVTSFAGGRGFPFGGMAPDLTCSDTASHRSRLALSLKSCVRLSRRKLPLGLSPRDSPGSVAPGRAGPARPTVWVQAQPPVPAARGLPVRTAPVPVPARAMK